GRAGRVAGALVHGGWWAAGGLRALRAGGRGRPPAPHSPRPRRKGPLPYLHQRSGRWLRRRASPAEVGSIEQLRAEFKQLIGDPTVRGVVMVLEGLRVSAGKREALATLFRQMRSAGNLVVAYDTHTDNNDYQPLWSAAR